MTTLAVGPKEILISTLYDEAASASDGVTTNAAASAAKTPYVLNPFFMLSLSLAYSYNPEKRLCFP
jgi:hypothetical protein